MKRKLRLGCLGGLLVLFLVVLIVHAIARFTVEPWPDMRTDVDTAPAHAPLDELTPDNGFWHLNKLSSAPFPSKELTRVMSLPAFEFPSTNVANFVQQQTNLIAVLEAALAAPTLQSVPEATPHMLFIKLARLTAWRMEQAAASNDWVSVERLLEDQMKLNRGFSRGGGTYALMNSFAGDSIVWDNLIECAEAGAPPPDLLERLQARLANVGDELEHPREAIKVDWLATEKLITEIYRGDKEVFGMESLGFVRPVFRLFGSGRKSTTKHFEQLFSHMIAEADSPYLIGDGGVLDSWIIRNHRYLTYVADDAYGRRLSLYIIRAHSSSLIVDKHHMHRARLDATVLALAIRRYQLEEGELPNTLEALVPKYVQALPVDPASPEQAPLRYRLLEDDYVLYSLGRDQVDDGGLLLANSNQSKNMIFHPTRRQRIELLDRNVETLIKAGDALVAAGKMDEAKATYEEAWEVLPYKKDQYRAAGLLRIALGKWYAKQGKHSDAASNFMDATTFPGGNVASVYFLAGKHYFENDGDSYYAAKAFKDAYRLGGYEIFKDEDPKYLRFLKDESEPPSGGWPDE